MTKTLVIGLDGATFDVLDPLIEEGVMPNLESLYASGASGPLQSTMPPVTGPAWLSLATGLSPGSTGIYDFIRRKPNVDGFDFEYVGGNIYQGRAVWDFLSEANVEVGVIDYPTLSPPYPVNGFMVCGGMGSVGHESYPDRLEEDLEQFEKPEEHLDLRDSKYQDLTVFFDDITENLVRRNEIVTWLLRNESWEFCWPVFQEPDWLQHMMWKCFDDTHPEAEEVTAEEREMFRDFWALVDEVIGECADAAGQDTNIIVQSDHGFGPMYDRSFRLNTWLKEQGYLVPKRFASSHFWVKKGIRNLMSDVASAVNLKQWAPGLFKRGKDQTASMAIQLNALNLEETQVFDPGHIGSMGGLYINDGALGPGTDETKLKTEVREKLLAFGHENDLDISVYFPEELYGEKVSGSPDIIVRVAGTMIEDGGWDEAILDDRPERLSHQNGSHREEGVFIASGPDFIETKLEGANVWDIAPTLLHCMKQPIPANMDGDVLEEIFVDDRPIQRLGLDEYDNRRLPLDDEEQAEVAQQLSDLGYFD